MSRIPTGETSFSMVYRAESIIPVEIEMSSFRTSNLNKDNNETEPRLNLDLLGKKGSELRHAKLLTNNRSSSTTTRGSSIGFSCLVTWS